MPCTWLKSLMEHPLAPRRRLTPSQRAGHVGLWPAFSLINHSCTPSASFLTLALGPREGEEAGAGGGGAGREDEGAKPVMLVRAARPIASGEEVRSQFFQK
jgi:hypothetical protein